MKYASRAGFGRQATVSFTYADLVMNRPSTECLSFPAGASFDLIDDAHEPEAAKTLSTSFIALKEGDGLVRLRGG